MLKISFGYAISPRCLPDDKAPLSQTLSPLSRYRMARRLVVAARRGMYRLIRCWRRARNHAALTALTDRMLDDIGLTRVEVAHAIVRPFWAE